MAKCSCCLKKTTIANSMNCKWCTNLYCIKCLPLELHNCNSQEDCKTAALNDLSNKLENGKTVDKKCIKI